MLRSVISLSVLTLLCAGLPARSQCLHKTRLNTGWEFLKGDLGGIWEAVRPAEKGRPESVPVWTEVQLPHSINAHDAVDPDVNYYQGPGWYRTLLEISNPYQQGRTLLHFEGAGQKTEVYVYMTKVGSHVGGYDEWSVDITEAVEAFKKTDAFKTQFNGKVPVVIRCDNSRDLEMIPSDLSDFNLYGGIYRYLNLMYVPALSIDKVFASAGVDEKGKLGELNVRARFYDPAGASSADIEVRLLDPEGAVVDRFTGRLGSFSGDQAIWATAVKKPQLWSPSSPRLYTVEVSLKTAMGTHTLSEKIGFRNFKFMEKGPFHLNGERLLLRGTHRHEDHAGVANAMTEDQIRTEMVMMKEMGVNFIRLGHYQQSRIVLELCDSLGILVWEEIPWCRGGLGGEVYKDQARRMLTNMIGQHYNHPSVIIWGLGNENDWPGDFPVFDQEKIRRFMTELNDIAHRLDPSRKTAIRRCDFCKDIVDVYSPSIWAGWYRGIYTEYKEVSREEFSKVDHFLHVEWGGDSHARRHSENPDNVLAGIATGGGADERAGDAALFGGAARVSKDGDWSESYIVNLIDWHLKEQETMPWLTGTAYWPFKDFSTPIRPDNPVPYMNQKGVVERDFNKKESYYVFQSYWTEKPMAHIYGHTWPVRWGDAGEKKMIKVYSNCEKAELFVNGKSQGMKKRNSQDFPAAGLRWMVQLQEGENHVRVIAREGTREVVDEITFEYQTEQWGEPAKMVLEKLSEENDTAAVQVRLLDKKGVPCLDAANWIRFSLAGDGELIDNQGTSTGSGKVQLYNGRAMIKVETKGGKNVICVQSDGIPTVLLNLDRENAGSGKSRPQPVRGNDRRDSRPDSTGSRVLKVDYKSLIAVSDLVYTEPAARSEAGMPIGNGRMGSLVWTSPDAVKLQVNRVDVFGNDASSNNFYQRHTDYCGGIGFVDVDFGGFAQVFTPEDFRQRLSCYDGTVSVKGKGVSVELLAWNEKDVFALRITDSREDPEAISINLRTLRTAVQKTGDHSAVSTVSTAGDRILLVQEFREGDYFNASAILIGAAGRKVRAQAVSDREVRLLAEAGKGDFFIYIASAATFDPEADAARLAGVQLNGALRPGYDEVLGSNKKWWHDFWRKSFVALDNEDGTAEFIEANYHYYLYVMASSSRGAYPAKFNGMLWTTGGDTRKWGSAFWGANQSCLYNALLPANHIELMAPMFHMYTAAYPAFERAARQQWGAEGIYIPETMTFNGPPALPDSIAREMRQLYLAKRSWAQHSRDFSDYAFTKMPFLSRWNWKQDGGWENGRWNVENKGGGAFGHVTHIFSRGAKIAYQYWQKYEYTQDREWLREKAWPMLKGMAEFYRNFPNVKKEEDGKYHIYHVNDNESVWGGHNTVEEIAAMRGIFPVVIKASELLGTDPEMRPVWKEFIDHLSPLPLSTDYPETASGQPTWTRALPPIIKGNGNQHPDRNTMPVWFFDLAGLENPDKETLAIANATYDTYFPNGINGDNYPYVLSRLPVIGTMLGREDAVRYLIPNQLRRGPEDEVLPNRMDLSEGPYTTNIQRLGRAAEALHAALCQSFPPGPGEEPVIRIFPAWPPEWKASFSLLCRGNFLVTSSIDEGLVEFVEVFSNTGSECRIRNPWPGKVVSVYRSGKKEDVKTTGPLIVFNTVKEGRYILIPEGGSLRTLLEGTAVLK